MRNVPSNIYLWNNAKLCELLQKAISRGELILTRAKSPLYAGFSGTCFYEGMTSANRVRAAWHVGYKLRKGLGRRKNSR